MVQRVPLPRDSRLASTVSASARFELWALGVGYGNGQAGLFFFFFLHGRTGRATGVASKRRKEIQ